MAKIYHLSTCKTCQKVIAALNHGEGFELQDIKTNHISAAELDVVKGMVGSYEGLFSRRAMKYRSMGLADQDLNEADYRELILGEYTFLKRPLILIGDQAFMGSSKKTLAAVLEALQKQ